jgi:hypothetical protein
VVARAHAGSHLGDGLLGEGAWRPRRREARDVEQEGGKHVAAAGRVDHLGVELHAVDAPLGVADRAEGRVAADADGLEAGRKRGDAVAVGHPHVERLALGEAMEDAFGPLDDDSSVAVLALLRGLDLAAELVGDELQAVADAEHRDAEVENALVDAGRALAVHARGAAREDDGARVHGGELLEGEGARVDLAVDALLPDAPRDELRVLGAEVEDEDELAGRHEAGSRTGPGYRLPKGA